MFLIAVSASIVGQMLVIYFPPLQAVFQTEALTLGGKLAIRTFLSDTCALRNANDLNIKLQLYYLYFYYYTDIVGLVALTSTVFIFSECKKWIERRTSRPAYYSKRKDLEDLV